MSNIDVSTGQSDVPLFRYRMFSESYPVYAKIWFKASVLSPSLGIENRTTLIEMESNAFEMKADIVIDNRNFSTNSTSLLEAYFLSRYPFLLDGDKQALPFHMNQFFSLTPQAEARNHTEVTQKYLQSSTASAP